MPAEPKKTFKYVLHLATTGVTKLEDLLTENASAKAMEIHLQGALPYPCKLFVRPWTLITPLWADRLAHYFSVNDSIKSASSAAVLLFKANGRVLACSFGHGHTMLDDDRKENDFGLLVAANSLSDQNVRLVEKANLGSVIRDATQAAGITRLQEFNVDRALSLVRKLSGNAKDNSSALSGANSITITSEKDLDELHELGSDLVNLYAGTKYKSTAFAIIDKIKPVLNVLKIEELDQEVLNDLTATHPSFELGAPDIDTEPIGYLTISGSGKRTRFADITLSTYLSQAGAPQSVDDLHKHKIVTHNAEGTHKIREWSVYRGLVGSIEVDSIRYALNEGKWYRIEDSLRTSANQAFDSASKGLDKSYLPWPVIIKGKDGKAPTYEIELNYNTRVCLSQPKNLLLFDQHFFPIPGVPSSRLEVCDIFDVENKRLIHVKKSGRRSSVISHFIAQGINSAKSIRTYAQIKDAFLVEVAKRTDQATAVSLGDAFPQEWTVEYKFADAPTQKGDYTIPFFSRVTFDEAKREIEALGYKAVEVTFIRLSS